MKPPVVHHDKEDKDKVEIRAECRAATEDGRKHLEKVELKTQDMDTLKYVERKLIEKGVQRLERHPADGLPLKHEPKKGHGGKYSWEGPNREFENEIWAEAAIDEKDPNYDDDKEDEEEVGKLVVGEIEIPKVAKEGVARIEVHPHLKTN